MRRLRRCWGLHSASGADCRAQWCQVWSLRTELIDASLYRLYVCVSVCENRYVTCVYIYIYIHLCMYIYIYIYI